MTVYRVTGTRAYRGHAPGATFEAVLTPDSEQRALKFGAIELVERSAPGIRPGSYRLPRRRKQATTRAAARRKE